MITLAALSMTPNARAQKIQSDVEKRVNGLDSKYPGSSFSQRLKSHGKDGRYIVLVVGPFASLSDDFMVLCDFLGRVRAFRAISSWNISPKHALAINRHILIKMGEWSMTLEKPCISSSHSVELLHF